MRLLTAKELSSYFNVSVKTIYTWVRRGVLVPIRVGRTLRFDPQVISVSTGDS